MTGASPSMVRAGLVTGLSLLAWYVGRKFHPVVLLGLVSAMTVLWNPNYAWGDMGWMLSFAAFAGVIIVAPIMSAYFFSADKVSSVAQILLETLAAQLVTAPIIMVAFGQFKRDFVISKPVSWAVYSFGNVIDSNRRCERFNPSGCSAYCWLAGANDA